MYCAKCGKLMKEGSAFCNNCGAKMQHGQTAGVQSDPVLNTLYTSPPVAAGGKPLAKSVGIAKAKVIAVLGAFLMFVFCLVFLVILNLRGAISEMTFERIVEDVDIAHIRVGRMLELRGQAYDRDITLSEWVYAEIHPGFIHQYNITLRSVENLIDTLPVDEYVVMILTRYADGLLDGDENIRIFHREIEDFIRRNERHIYRELGIELSEYQYTQLNNALNDFDLQRISHLGTTLRNEDINLSLIRWALSPLLLVVAALLVLLIPVGMHFLCGLGLRRTFMISGITLASAGAVFVILRLSIDSIISNMLPINLDRVLLNAITSGMHGSIMLSGLITLIIGAVLIGLYIGFPKIAGIIKKQSR